MRIDKKKAAMLFALTLLITSLLLININGPISATPSPSPPPPMYWKANYTDYAPSGVPDFDQRQMPHWKQTGLWSWCVPAAVANSLWWMDSRFETSTTPPPTISDTFPLVSAYGPWDDHDPNNTVPLIDHLAYLMDTDGLRTFVPGKIGTNVFDAQAGIAQYLSWSGVNPLGDVNGDGITDMTDWHLVNAVLNGTMPFDIYADIWPVTTGWPGTPMADNVVDANDLALVTANLGLTGMFYEKTVQGPDFYYVEEEVERSEDVILILGFYYEIAGDWYRYDEPYWYEYGHAVTAAGVNSSELRIAISDPIQDNAEPPPRGTNGLGRVIPSPPHPHNVAPPYTLHNNATYVSHDIYNVNLTLPPLPYPANFSLINYSSPQFPGMLAVVEWAVTVSPLEEVPPPEMYWKADYPNYAPSGMPDFDQRQDHWNTTTPPYYWTWCAPTAVANSLWWFDSKFHPSNLLTVYPGTLGEHDPSNVMPFIQHLAWLMDTDGQRTAGILPPHDGTWTWDMETGIAQYLSWSGVNPLGDVNGDGITDMTDWHLVNAVLNGTRPFNIDADIWPETVTGPYTADGLVNINDLTLVVNNLGQTGQFYERTWMAPDFYDVEYEVEQSEDVVLVLGFWFNPDPGVWIRADYDTPYDQIGLGHAVTVAGINSSELKIAISDPAVDAFEAGATPGRSPVPHVHVPLANTATHNNASLVSHDIYNVTILPPGSPGKWALQGYVGNPQAGAPPGTIAVVEAAVITSPLEVEVSGVNITNIIPYVNVQNLGLVQLSTDAHGHYLAFDTWTVKIQVTVHNNGTATANYTVNAYYSNATGTYPIGTSKNITNLDPCNSANVTFDWNLPGVKACRSYTIKANATSPSGASHELVMTPDVKVTIKGNVDDSAEAFPVNILDVGAVAWTMAIGGYEVLHDLNLDGAINILDVGAVAWEMAIGAQCPP